MTVLLPQDFFESLSYFRRFLTDGYPQFGHFVSKITKLPKSLALFSWKVFRLQWEAKGESSAEVAPTNNEFFEQQVAWGDETEGNGDDTWESATPSKKAHVETTDDSVSAVVDTPKVAFEQLLEPYFVEFEAEDLSKM